MQPILPCSLTRTLAGLVCVLVVQMCLPGSVYAQSPSLNETSVHWAYSSYFGTGWYEVRDNRDVYVLRMTPRWDLREASISENGSKTLGIELKLSMTAGLDSFSFTDIPGASSPDNLASLSATPGVDVTIPMNDRWTLRPYAAVGWGKLLNDNESAWTYWAGIKSRYTFSRGDLDWALINTISYVGYTPSDGSAENFWPLMAGLEFDYPLADYKLAGEQLFVSWHGTYTSFESDVDLDFIAGETEPITDQWEFGLALHKDESRIKIAWFSFDRLGLAYRFSSSGDLKGISLILRSTFDR